MFQSLTLSENGTDCTTFPMGNSPGGGLGNMSVFLTFLKAMYFWL